MKINCYMHRFEPITSHMGIHRYTNQTANRLFSGDSDHEALQVRHTGIQRVEKSAEMWNKKRNLTTLWLCTMATGKGQGTQNWPLTEAYDDGP